MSSSPHSSRGLRKSPINDRGSSVRNALINRAAPQKPSITEEAANQRGIETRNRARKEAVNQRGIETRNRARAIKAKIKAKQFKNSQSNM
jgi:hypothetical protein